MYSVHTLKREKKEKKWSNELDCNGWRDGAFDLSTGELTASMREGSLQKPVQSEVVWVVFSNFQTFGIVNFWVVITPPDE